MPFGLKNTGATFQRLMEECLGDLQPGKCLLYLNDVIVHSENFLDLLKNLEMVFHKLHDYGLKLKPSKCKFFRTRLQYLGHAVSAAGVKTDPEKTELGAEDMACATEPQSIAHVPRSDGVLLPVCGRLCQVGAALAATYVRTCPQGKEEGPQTGQTTRQQTEEKAH